VPPQRDGHRAPGLTPRPPPAAAGSILDTIVQTLPKLVDAICVTPLEDVECSTVVAQRRRLR
jgi:hypothetical protein